MQLSFGELVVLASATHAKERRALAQDAALLFPSTKYDVALALVDIKLLEDRKFLAAGKDQKLSVTRAGWAAAIEAIPVIENLRAALAGVTFKIR